MQKSIYEIIVQNIKEEELHEGFVLPERENPYGVPFADGALDGIYRYHMEQTGIDAAGVRQMRRTLNFGSAGYFEETDDAFAKLAQSVRAVSAISDLQIHILKNKERYDTENRFQTAMH